ncbi:adenosylcobalamin-dependent ribonucleoside-diphosphate reductase [Pelomyxa schiedti]|nr:adenosylcobalamin-dependent ribonucleoside-diphosphate reductase [Pelomyxa schiedti]
MPDGDGDDEAALPGAGGVGVRFGSAIGPGTAGEDVARIGGGGGVLSENGVEVLRRRYLRKEADGKTPAEDVPQMFWRVAANVAFSQAGSSVATSSTQGSVSEVLLKRSSEYYEAMTKLLFFPNSPTFTGAGTPLGQLAACFVLGVDDDMGKDSAEGIFNTLRNAALIQQTGGGLGFSFSRLRPKGDRVASSNGFASGPVSFLRVYDAAFGAIAQGGSRRGANMAVLRVDHPDIREFISCKAVEGSIANFNISVALTDAFMCAVRNNEKHKFINPRTGQECGIVEARTLLGDIVASSAKNGEPGVLFIDAANRGNPVPDLYTLEATNPCGEQWLGPFENCCLASVNLARHMLQPLPENKNDDEPAYPALSPWRVDWIKLANTVRMVTRFLDDVIDANKYVPAVPQLQQAAHNIRRIGVGVMGLADAMYQARVRYGARDSIIFASQVMEWVRYHTMCESVLLARERGSFPAFSSSIFNPEKFTWLPPTALSHALVSPPSSLESPVDYAQSFGRPGVDWEGLMKDIKTYGIRNAAHTTVAPTGTIGTVTGCEGYGCEPVFALAYTRRVKEASGDVVLQYVSPLFMSALEEAGIVGAEKTRIVDHVLQTGTCQDLSDLPEVIKHTFVVSQDVSATEHVLVQAAMQRFVDNSISKTVNFPPNTTADDIWKTYMLAWELGCKGLTIYVTGSRQSVVLETQATSECKKQTAKEEPTPQPPTPPLPVEAPKLSEATTSTATSSQSASKVVPPQPQVVVQQAQPQGYLTKRPRPKALEGLTVRCQTPMGPAYLTVNSTSDKEPFEIFLTVGKGGSDVSAVSEAVGRLMSIILRIPSVLTPTERLAQIVEQLRGIGGAHQSGFGPKRIRSLPDALAHTLDEYLKERALPQSAAPSSLYTSDPEHPPASSTPLMRTTSLPSSTTGAPLTPMRASPAPSAFAALLRSPGNTLASPSSFLSRPIGDLCPECGNSTLLNTEGCKKCHNCGYSEC